MMPENVVDVVSAPVVSVASAPPLLVTVPAPASEPIVSANPEFERRTARDDDAAGARNGVGDAELQRTGVDVGIAREGVGAAQDQDPGARFVPVRGPRRDSGVGQ